LQSPAHVWHVKRCNIWSLPFVFDNFPFVLYNFTFVLYNFLLVFYIFYFYSVIFHLYFMIFHLYSIFSINFPLVLLNFLFAFYISHLYSIISHLYSIFSICILYFSFVFYNSIVFEGLFILLCYNGFQWFNSSYVKLGNARSLVGGGGAFTSSVIWSSC
jgi:hypothetical protein